MIQIGFLLLPFFYFFTVKTEIIDRHFFFLRPLGFFIERVFASWTIIFYLYFYAFASRNCAFLDCLALLCRFIAFLALAVSVILERRGLEVFLYLARRLDVLLFLLFDFQFCFWFLICIFLIVLTAFCLPNLLSFLIVVLSLWLYFFFRNIDRLLNNFYDFFSYLWTLSSVGSYFCWLFSEDLWLLNRLYLFHYSFLYLLLFFLLYFLLSFSLLCWVIFIPIYLFDVNLFLLLHWF